MGEKPNILIAVPAYGGSVTTQTAMSLLALGKAFTEQGVAYRVRMLSGADVVLVRNLYAAQVVDDDTISDLLFVDHDMGFEPHQPIRLKQSGLDVVGYICPMRRIDIGRALQLARDGHDDVAALARATPFATTLPNPPTKSVHASGAIEVSTIGMGLTLISRRCLLQIASSMQIRNDTSNSFGRVMGYFDQIYTETVAVSEDKSFCQRWRHCGGKVYAFADEAISHIGPFTYKARMIDALDG